MFRCTILFYLFIYIVELVNENKFGYKRINYMQVYNDQVIHVV